MTVGELRARLTLETAGFSRALTDADSKLKKLGGNLTSIGAKMSVALTAPIVLLGKQVLEAGSSFESAFAGVRKTVNATEPEFAALRQSFRDMAKEIPITANELAKIGEAAGQLGIKKENILGFTRTMADLGATTNLTSDDAATMLARFANITGLAREATPAYDRLGATIVDLGNNFATTEAEIVEMALRLAGAGESIGLTEAQILGMATTLSSVGIHAEAGGSAFSRVMLNMQSAVKSGSAELSVFAKVAAESVNFAGKSVADFTDLFKRDANEAILVFVEGLKQLNDQGADVTKILGQVELNELRVRDALLRTSNATDLLRNAVGLGTKAWESNTAQTIEATKRYQTFESQVQLLKNQIIDVSISLFDKLRPSLLAIIDVAKGIVTSFSTISTEVVKAGAVILGVFAAGGPILLGIGAVVSILGGPLTLAIVGVTTAFAVLAGEWALKSRDMGTSAQSIRTAVETLATTIGVVMDVVGSFANAFLLAFKTVALVLFDIFSPIILAIGALRGKFTETWEMIKRTNRNIASDIADTWDDLGADLTGRWTGTMRGLVNNTQTTSDEISRLGTKAGNLYVVNFEHAVNNIGPWANGIMSEAENVAIELSHLGKAAGLNWATAFSSAAQVRAFSPEAQRNIGPWAQGIMSEADAIQETWKQAYKHLQQWGFKVVDSAQDTGRKAGEGLAGGIKSGAGKAKDTLNDFLRDLNDWAKANDVAVNFTEKLWKSLSASVKASLQSLRSEYQKANAGIEQFINETIIDLMRLTKANEDAFVKATQDSIKGMQGLNVEVAKTNDNLHNFEEQTILTSKATEGMEAALAKVPNQMRALGVGALQARTELTGLVQTMIETWKASIQLQNTMEAMVKQATIASNNIKFTAEHVHGLGKAMEAAEPHTEKLNKQVEEFRRAMEEVSRRIPPAVNTILDAFGKLSLKTKSIFADIFDIIGLLPGKVGSALQRAVNEFERWFQLLDKVIRVVERVFGENETEGIIGIIKSALGKVTSSVQSQGTAIKDSISGVLLDAMNGASNAASKAGAGIGISLAKGLGGSLAVAIPSIIGGLFGARGQGRLGGALSGALGGLGAALGVGSIFHASLGALFTGPAAPFVLGGIGLFAGLGALFGGKSELEKAQEAAQKQQAKDAIRLSQEQVNQAIEATKQSLIQTADQARALLEGLLDFTKVPKETIKAFFQNLTQVMNEFAKMAERWKTESLEKTKALADAMGPVVQSIGAAVVALSGMSSFVPVAESIITEFFTTLKIVIEKFGALADEIPNKLEKHAKKFADRMLPVVGLIGEAIFAFFGDRDGRKGLIDFRNIAEESFDGLKIALDLAARKMGEIADSIDTAMVKNAQRFSEKMLSVVSLISESVDAFKKLATLGTPIASGLGFSNGLTFFFDQLREALEGMNKLASELSIEYLGRAEQIALKAGAIVSFIANAAEAFASVKEYTKIPEESMQALLDDFKRALDLLHLLLSDADRFQEMAESFSAKITAGADALRLGIEDFSSSFLSALSILSKSIGHVQGGLAAPALTLAPAGGSFSVATAPTPQQTSNTGNGGGNIYYQFGDILMSESDPRMDQPLRSFVKNVSQRVNAGSVR